MMAFIELPWTHDSERTRKQTERAVADLEQVVLELERSLKAANDATERLARTGHD